MKPSKVSTAPEVVPASAPRRLPANLSRANLALLAILLVQLGLIAFVFWPKETAASDQPLVAGLTAEQVQAIEIAGSNDTVVRLERSDDGWALADTDGFPAKSDKVTQTLEKLLAIREDRPVTQTPASHKRLQVAQDAYARRIALETDSGEKVLFLGASAGAGATHVRLDGEDATFLTGEIATWDIPSSPTDWINTQYVSTPADDIKRISVRNAQGEVEFVRDEEGKWTLADLAEGETPNSTDIGSFANRLAAINLTAPLGKELRDEYGFDSPLAKIDLEMENQAGESSSMTLTVGAKRDNGSYAFKSSASEYYVEIASYTGDPLVGRSRADFLVQAEESEAVSEDTGEGAAVQAAASETEAVATEAPPAEASTNQGETAVPVSPLATPEP